MHNSSIDLQNFFPSKQLNSDGFVLNKYAENIMNEFGGIEVNCIINSKEHLGYHGATFEFDIYYGWNQDFLLKPFEENRQYYFSDRTYV